MKKNRKLTALLVAACMTLPMAATTFTVPMVASAAKITINGTTNENTTMQAYQVFTGIYNDTDNVLAVSGWGNGINVINFITALLNDSTFGINDANLFKVAGVTASDTAAMAQKVATAINGNNLTDAQKEAFAKLAVKHKSGTAAGTSTTDGDNLVIDGLADGYYVIVDTSAGVDEAYTLGLLQVAGNENADVNVKRVAPTVTKTAKDSTDGEYDTVVDCEKGEIVNFKVLVDVPDLSKYTDYYLEIVDTLGSDFTLDEGSVKLRVGNPDNGTEITFDNATNGTRSYNFVNGTITIQLEDATSYSDQKLYLTYSATLNENATTGEQAFDDDTQKNKVVVHYLNDPNNVWKPEDSNSIEKPSNLSSTTSAVVKAYTYKIKIHKYDGNQTSKSLSAAKFVLLNSNDEETAKYAQKAENNGSYTITWVDSIEQASVFETTGEDGVVEIIGLDAGTYWLKEKEAPPSYNILTELIKVDIVPTYGNTPKTLTALSESKIDNKDTDVDVQDGRVEVDVANNKGATLPETGGIGTKIFYILGGTLVIGSGAALVIKKRMGKDEE